MGEQPANEPITMLVVAARAGDRAAAERLYSAVYEDLRRIAGAQRARLRPGDTTSTTVLVHELYLRLERAESLSVQDRHHFFSLAARAMRQILIDAARRDLAERRGGDFYIDTLDGEAPLAAPERPQELLRLDEALGELQAQDAALAELVEMHFFGGLSFESIAETSTKSERTLRRDWRRARAFLYDRMAASS